MTDATRSFGDVFLGAPALGAPSRVRPLLVGRAWRDAEQSWSNVARRGLNVLVAVVGVLLTAPLMLAIAVLVRLTSPGPVFYVQTRVGLDRRASPRRVDETGNGRRHRDLGGKPFRMLKFRTMVVSDHRQRQVWAQPDDPRVTGLGRLLRRFRLDELPQLVNVLAGDMNVVGPRPEQPSIFEDLRREIAGYELRQIVRPGITGWAQIRQGYDRTVDDVRRKLRLDLEYIARRDAWEDLRIMLRTPWVMLGRQGW